MQDHFELKFSNQIETPLKYTRTDPINDLWIDNFISHANPCRQTNLRYDDDYPLYYRNLSDSRDCELSDFLTYRNFNQFPQDFQDSNKAFELNSHVDSIEYLSQTNLEPIQKIENSENISFTNITPVIITKINNIQSEVLVKHKSMKLEQSKKISKKKKKTSIKKIKRLSERLKNIVKNYGKNCATFAIGPIGDSIIGKSLSQEEIPRFRDYIRCKIPKITNIKNFRELLLVTEIDQPEIAKFKQAFQSASEIFIKNYSTNWIFHSKRINDVKNHIFARFKMLRRVRDPKNFTYIH